MIVTTNLKLDEIKNPPDLAHARIYDRILERCAPILFVGKNFREENAAATRVAAKEIVTQSRLWYYSFSEKGTPMNHENTTPFTTPVIQPNDAPAMVRKIGKTTYKVRVHFSDTSRETMSDKIKRMLKNEVSQM